MSIPEVLIVGDSLPDAYHKAIRAFSENYQVADCEDWNLQKKEQYTQRECAMTVHVKKPLLEPMISKLIIYGARELEQYRMEILDGILDFAVEAGVEDYT